MELFPNRDATKSDTDDPKGQTPPDYWGPDVHRLEHHHEPELAEDAGGGENKEDERSQKAFEVLCKKYTSTKSESIGIISTNILFMPNPGKNRRSSE